MRIHTFIKRLLPLVACFLIATAGTSCDDGDLSIQELRKAADQGDVTAQNNLSVKYLVGDGVPQDSKESVKWCRKAAEQGNADAQQILGSLYSRGEGVPKNTATAYAWFNTSAANGGKFSSAAMRDNIAFSSTMRDSIAKEMTPDQIAEAQALSAKWFEIYQPKDK